MKSSNQTFDENKNSNFLLQDVERFANFRRNIGVPVETVCFHDAEHVKLYIKHPQKYIHCVCTFISNCLTLFPDKKCD